MANIKVKRELGSSYSMNDTPKLMNGYGEVFDYKDSDKAQLASEKLHQMKLNLERENRKLKMGKKVEKNNYYKFKNTQKITKKSELTSCKFKYHAELNLINDINKYMDIYIPINSFILEEIKNIDLKLKSNYANSKKALESMRYEDEEDATIEQNIKLFHADAINYENKLLAIQNALKSLEMFNFSHSELTTAKDFVSMCQESIDVQSENYHNDIIKTLKKIFDAYQHQYYFIYNNETFDYEGKKEALKVEYHQSVQNCKEKYKVSIKNEKDRINTNCKSGIQKNIVESKKYNLKVNQEELKKLKCTKKDINKEIKEETIEKEKTIKYIKQQEKELYQNRIAQYKQENVLSTNKGTNIKEIVSTSDYTKSSKLALSPKLHKLNNWSYKADLLDIKADYLISVGQAIQKLSWDGDYLMKSGQALKEKTQQYRECCTSFKQHLQSIDVVGPMSKMSSEDKQIYKAEKRKLGEKYKQDIAELKNQKTQKEVTGTAYKNQKLKLTVFYEEDVKAIKTTLASSKGRYQTKDAYIQFKKQQDIIKKEHEQAMNNISKEIPIEVKKNTSIWMTLLAFFLPGVDQLIIKNWKKAFWFLILTLLCWAVFIPYAFGAYNIKGDGIMGLVKLSWVKVSAADSPIYGALYSDARYALVEGVIGVILLVISISYFSISAYQCWKIVRSMEKGIRCNTWLETRKILRTSGFPYAISVPGLICILFIVIMPIIVSLLLAFTNIGTDHNPAAGQETNWVGFDQFKRLFSDPAFFEPLGQVLWWNIVWAIATTLLVLFFGTIMALAIENKNIKAKAMWRTIFILPWAIPAFVSILFFKVIFSDSSTGLMNSWLLEAGIIDKAISWQTEAVASRLILILIQGWLGHSYIVLLVSGNLKAISSDIYEAAMIDGANPKKQFFKITLPIVLLQIAPLLIGQFTFNFNNFGVIWLFNDGGSKIDPHYIYNVGNNDILLSWIFKMTFGSSASTVVSNQAIASALVIVMSLFIVTASGVGFARTKAFRRGEEI